MFKNISDIDSVEDLVGACILSDGILHLNQIVELSYELNLGELPYPIHIDTHGEFWGNGGRISGKSIAKNCGKIDNIHIDGHCDMINEGVLVTYSNEQVAKINRGTIEISTISSERELVGINDGKLIFCGLLTREIVGENTSRGSITGSITIDSWVGIGNAIVPNSLGRLESLVVNVKHGLNRAPRYLVDTVTGGALFDISIENIALARQVTDAHISRINIQKAEKSEEGIFYASTCVISGDIDTPGTFIKICKNSTFSGRYHCFSLMSESVGSIVFDNVHGLKTMYGIIKCSNTELELIDFDSSYIPHKELTETNSRVIYTISRPKNQQLKISGSVSRHFEDDSPNLVFLPTLLLVAFFVFVQICVGKIKI